jgi:hypothetical protein
MALFLTGIEVFEAQSLGYVCHHYYPPASNKFCNQSNMKNFSILITFKPSLSTLHHNLQEHDATYRNISDNSENRYQYNFGSITQGKSTYYKPYQHILVNVDADDNIRV